MKPPLIRLVRSIAIFSPVIFTIASLILSGRINLFARWLKYELAPDDLSKALTVALMLSGKPRV